MMFARLIFDSLTKLMKILTKKNSVQQFLFHFSSSTGCINLLSVNLLKRSKTQTIRRQFADELFKCV